MNDNILSHALTMLVKEPGCLMLLSAPLSISSFFPFRHLLDIILFLGLTSRAGKIYTVRGGAQRDHCFQTLVK